MKVFRELLIALTAIFFVLALIGMFTVVHFVDRLIQPDTFAVISAALR